MKGEELLFQVAGPLGREGGAMWTSRRRVAQGEEGARL